MATVRPARIRPLKGLSGLLLILPCSCSDSRASGLSLDHSETSLALLYLATVQALAHGTRHIIEYAIASQHLFLKPPPSEMNAKGYKLSPIMVTGGLSKNALFVEELAST